MKKIALILFFIVALGELVSIATQSERLLIPCKPMIMVTLGVYYLLSAGEDRSFMVLLAIIFSLAGDVSLMFDSVNSIYFMVGLVSFLISHVFYIIAYRQHQNSEQEDSLQGIQKLRAAFPIVLAGTGLVVILYPALGAMKFPVIVYALVLVVMVLNALFRLGRTSVVSFWFVFVGAMFFMVSDSLLAVNKFLEPLPHSGLLVMSTYISAQFLIIEGLIAHPRK
ncbi:MAG TPA: lysoplasmalogenase [Chryseolinea sp.]|nr:lysoplasmalogenase [Chryseolinea sp.]